MKKISYTNDEGLKQVVEVPTDIIDETLYRHGIHLGPPDLSALNLDQERRIALNNLLCDAEIIDYQSLSGRRHEVVEKMKQLGIPDQDAKHLMVALVAIYQGTLYISDSEI